jgi:hypothetical protein
MLLRVAQLLGLGEETLDMVSLPISPGVKGEGVHSRAFRGMLTQAFLLAASARNAWVS